ncbi:hypothetical protein [Serratia marcescens]|uniref:hypothetical protein n=1 Tax=Serratia marcescens TaxID=615 RepID=UPI003C7B0B65
MRYLCRLVTPAGGLVLDPFMGSGQREKRHCLRVTGLSVVRPDHLTTAAARIAHSAKVVAS